MKSRRSPCELYDEIVAPELTAELVYGAVPRIIKRGRQWRAPCPLHGGNNFNFVVNVESLAWFCHSKCGRGGGPLAFRNDGETPTGDTFKRVVEELAEELGVLRRHDEVSQIIRKPMSLDQARAKRAASYHPEEQIRAFWQSCIPVTDDDEVCRELSWWSVSSHDVADRDVARALPRDARVPWWATRTGTSWTEGYRIIVPAFDAHGVMRSFNARPVHPNLPKGAAPAGCSRSGLVMADALARELLRQGTRPEWLGNELLELIVTEGEKDFLVACTEWSGDDDCSPAVMGITGGSWTQNIADRVPDGTRVLIATDLDDVGNKYAREIYATFVQRDRVGTIEVIRWEQ